ncbi:MAG: pyridoxamine 5'-phosphate oxidase family protein [Candidatus Omnitrophica bacterium]|nr:pyridoxamine 5'-phosphate oxidase family protein [Candidatus Omnitrophota bacterium]
MKLSREIISFLEEQGFVIVSTIDEKGRPHNSCKGMVKISSDGKVFLLDVYKAKTLENLNRNHNMSITAVDEHKFRGYCLKGKGSILGADELDADTLKSWENKITSRTTQRLLKNVRGEKGHSRHPEIQLPNPKYMIYMEVEEALDLTPRKLK